MKREDIEKLLGGYATGTLTDKERQALFEAALTDQALFEALAGEEALKELLEDPHCRREIEQALRDQPRGFFERVTGWMRQPRVWALAGTLAVGAVLAVVVIRTQAPTRQFELAQRQPPPAQIAVPPTPPRQPAADLATRPMARATLPRADKLALSKPAYEPQTLTARLTAPAPPPPATPIAEDVPAAQEPMNLAAPPQAVQKTAQQQQTDSVGGAKGRVTQQAAAQSVMVDGTSVVDKKVQDVEQVSGAFASQNQRQAPLQLTYKVLAQGPNGQFDEAKLKDQQLPGAPLRVNLEANQAGYLYVSGARGLLLSTQAVPGANYVVEPGPEDRTLTVILSRYPVAVPPPSQAPARTFRAKQQQNTEDLVVVEIDLNRP
ncbi:MAG: hypothetical protein ACLQGV_20700 [Bryobacteraceae bacterium]